MSPRRLPAADVQAFPANDWDHPDTARWYRHFEQRHPRYARANAALVRHAAIAPGQRVLDLAAGTGGTAAALLPLLGPAGHIDCVEPAAAMRAAGRQRLGADPRVRWLSNLDQAGQSYDRIVCGAAMWQFDDLPTLLVHLASRLQPGGALCFNVPAAYLGLADAPGGGRDPWLTELPARLGRDAAADAASGAAAAPAVQARHATLPDAEQWQAWLDGAGWQARRWRHRQRFTQAALRDWLKIPVLTAGMWPAIGADERARRIDAACDAAPPLDATSWRSEAWLGWTAWRPAFDCAPLPAAPWRVQSGQALQAHARRDGCVLLRQLLPAHAVRALRLRVAASARALGLLDGRGRWSGPEAAAPHDLPAWVGLQQQLAQAPELQALNRHPALLALLERVIGAPPLPDQGSVVRLAPPEHRMAATPPHRDRDYLRGRPGLWVAWIPLVACTPATGVLAVAPGSHRDDAARRWAAARLRPGDVLLFSTDTLHRACPNRQPARARLSVDLRFLGPAPAPLQPGSGASR